MHAIKFKIEKELNNGLGRAGIVVTPHGVINTPAFVAVGTKATVKSLTPEQAHEIGCQVILANTYHLYLQPGEEIIKDSGGLGKFMNWGGPTMTDSGGFQAFSLGVAYGHGLTKFIAADTPPQEIIQEIKDPSKNNKKAKVTEEGVEFASIIDGSIHFLSPEKSIQIQNDIGADIIFALDEFTSPHAGHDQIKATIERTHRWAERSLAEHKKRSLTPNPLSEGKGGPFGYQTADKSVWVAMKEQADLMREKPTEAEEKLWQKLRNNLTGFHFRRQHVIGKFIVDFVCLQKKLVIEVDGDIHNNQKERDKERTNYLEQSGYKVIRFKNAEVLANVEKVLKDVVEDLKALPFGEGLGGAYSSVFGIVQGGRYEDLRKESARGISGMDFDGFGIGGTFVKEDIATAVKWVNEILPKEKPRHLLGVGEPIDIILGVENGCDTFDCVAPTRIARNGTLYTKKGKINITNTKYSNDLNSIEAGCQCYTCRNYTASYVSHLFKAHEMLAATLASIHNIFFLNKLCTDLRESIFKGTFEDYKEEFLKKYK